MFCGETIIPKGIRGSQLSFKFTIRNFFKGVLLMSVNEKDVSSYFTPYKYGKPILLPSKKKGEFDECLVDNMRICRHNGKFYCFFIGFDGKGYQTGLAVSEDLLNWEKKGVVLPSGSDRPWDTTGRAISCLLCDIDLYGNRELIKINGKYWMFYHAYPGSGYEVGAAANGIAWSTDEELLEWHCEDEPVFTKGEPGCWDGGGLYSTWVFPHDGNYVMYYNGKNNTFGGWYEQVGMAVSKNFYDWKRYEGNPVLKVTPNHWDSVFSCGQHVLYDSREKRWVMFYCGYDAKHAQDGVAISNDMVTWEKYENPIIPCGKPGEIDDVHAHKPCIIYHDGMLWHFYCAVGTTPTGGELRCISVARSKPF